jgi:hypothetical protein
VSSLTRRWVVKLSKKSKIWTLLLAVITGGVAFTAYALGPAAEAGVKFN